MPAIPQPIATFSKDPIAVLDYTIDWSDFVGDDSIATSTWTLDAGITNVGALSSRNLSIIFISGGVAGTGYNASNSITTAGGRTDKRTIRLNVVSR